MTSPLTERETPTLDGVFNFRDLGGLLAYGNTGIASGLLYRSDGLHRIGDRERHILADFGIRSVIDLRTNTERDGEGWFTADGVVNHHVPVIEQLKQLLETGVRPEDVLYEQYLTMIRSHGDAFATALDLIADSLARGEAIAYHCTAGKDRTGVLTALILSGIGADDETVATDYAKSKPAVGKMADWYMTNHGETPQQKMAEVGFDPSMADYLMDAEPLTMHRVLETVRADHGHVTDYLASIGALGSIARIGRALLG